MWFQITLIACALVVITQALDITLAISEEITTCAKENNVKNLRKVLLGEINDPNSKCLKHCIALKYKLISEDGALILDKNPKDSEFTVFAQTCAKEHTEGDKCERVNQLAKCIIAKYEQLPAECAKETNTNVDNIKDFTQNLIRNVSNAKMHCYYRCLIMKTKAMDGDGNVNIEFLIGTKYEKIIDHVQSCSMEHKQANVCTKSVMRILCVAQQYLKSIRSG